MKENIKVRFKEVFTKLLKENIEDSLLSFNPPTVDKLLEFNISDNTYTIFSDGKIALSKSDKYNSLIKNICIITQDELGLCQEFAFTGITSDEKLKSIMILNKPYFLVMQYKNVIIASRKEGVFGFEYVVCEENIKNHKSVGYHNIEEYINFTVALYAFSDRAKIVLKSFCSAYNNDELSSIAYVIQNLDSDIKNDSLLARLKSVLDKTYSLILLNKNPKGEL